MNAASLDDSKLLEYYKNGLMKINRENIEERLKTKQVIHKIFSINEVDKDVTLISTYGNAYTLKPRVLLNNMERYKIAIDNLGNYVDKIIEIL